MLQGEKKTKGSLLATVYMQCYSNRNYSWSFFVTLYQKTGSGPTLRDGIIKSCKHECENHEGDLKSVKKGRGFCLSGDILQW